MEDALAWPVTCSPFRQSFKCRNGTMTFTASLLSDLPYFSAFWFVVSLPHENVRIFAAWEQGWCLLCSCPGSTKRTLAQSSPQDHDTWAALSGTRPGAPITEAGPQRRKIYEARCWLFLCKTYYLFCRQEKCPFERTRACFPVHSFPAGLDLGQVKAKKQPFPPLLPHYHPVSVLGETFISNGNRLRWGRN